MQMMQLDYRQHSINIAKGTTTIQGLSSFAFLRVSTQPTILISTLVWFGIWVWFDKFGLGVWVSPVAPKAKLCFKLLLLERLNENLKQKHF